MQIQKETERLIRLTRFGLVNCFLVLEEDGFTLVDAGLRYSARDILAAAAQFGAPIRRIVLTHAHIDHVGSLDALYSSLPGVAVLIGAREAALMAGDMSLWPGESGKRLLGFIHVNTKASRTLEDGERVGSLQAVYSPGHTPGHVAYYDTRDGTMIAGDAFTTQGGLLVAGAFKWTFPMPAFFSWNKTASAESARKLRALNPTRLAVGHGKTLEDPLRAMDRAIEMAFQQCEKMVS
jgi:glyoxylase-like metal-dependent hydrolase (beta-lactamase superfamily II)